MEPDGAAAAAAATGEEGAADAVADGNGSADPLKGLRWILVLDGL